MFTKIALVRVIRAFPIKDQSPRNTYLSDTQNEVLAILREVGEGMPLTLAEIMAGGGWSWRNDAQLVRDALSDLTALRVVRPFDLWLAYEGQYGGGVVSSGWTVVDDPTVSSYTQLRNYCFYGVGVRNAR